MDDFIKPGVMRFICVLCAGTLFLPCVQAQCGEDAYYSSMFTSIWGIVVLIALGLVFFMCNSPHAADAALLGIVTGGFAIFALFMKAWEFEDRLAVKGYEVIDTEFLAGFYCGMILFILLASYSFLNLVTRIFRG